VDKLTQYREAVKSTLLAWHAYVSRATPKNGTDAECVFDDERGNYMLVFVGWHDGKRKQSVYIFVRIKDGKVWIEEDWTDRGIADELVRAGVPKEDIVLAFQPPELRHLTEFAVA
jgi:hypothetical protein